MKISRIFTPAVTVSALCVAVLAGCASAPRPSEAMGRAELSVERATQADGQRADAASLESAKQKLADSKVAAQKGDMKTADRLAQQSELDAQLAAARARAASAEAAATEVRAGLATLRDEAARAAAPSQNP